MTDAIVPVAAGKFRLLYTLILNPNRISHRAEIRTAHGLGYRLSGQTKASRFQPE